MQQKYGLTLRIAPLQIMMLDTVGGYKSAFRGVNCGNCVILREKADWSAKVSKLVRRRPPVEV